MPAVQGIRTRRSAVVSVVCLGALWAIAIYLYTYGLSGLAVDHAAVRDWLHGGDLYAYRSAARRGCALPPITALLLAPIAVLPLAVAGWLLALIGVAALLLATVALTGPVARRYGRPRRTVALVAGALALLTEPVRSALGLGHLDLVVFGLVTADVVALRRWAWARRRATWWPARPASRPAAADTRSYGRPATRSAAADAWSDGRRGPLRGWRPADTARRWWATGSWAGAGTGIATALAVAPILFILYFVVTRQWRAALTAVATATTLVLGGLLIAPSTTTAWLGTVLAQVDRAGPVDAPENQSLAGILARLYDSAGTPLLVWLSFAGLLVAVGLIRARSAHAAGDEITAFTLVGLTSTAVGPISRTYELIWLLPAVLILVDAAARRRLAGRRPRPRRFAGAEYAAGAVLVYLICVLDPTWTLPWNAYALVLLVLLNALPWRPGAAPALPPGPRPALPSGPRPGSPPRQPAIPGPRGS